MNVTVHPPTRKVEDATRVLHITDAGPVTEIHLQPEAGFLVFRDLNDFAWLISILVAARKDHEDAQARHDSAAVAVPDPTVTELRAAAFTELVNQALIDPDCAAGKHPSCPGGPCSCACHSEPGLLEEMRWQEAEASAGMAIAGEPPELPQRAEPHPCPPCQFGNHDDCYAADGKPCTCESAGHAESAT